jgi:Fibronectin type III domain
VVITAVSNYYSEIISSPPVFGAIHVFRTNEGGMLINFNFFRTELNKLTVLAPSEVRDVQVQLLNPWSIRVTWLPPREIRGSSVKYELLWSTEGTGLNPRQFGEMPVLSSEQYGTRISAVIDKLSPSQIYHIKVRYSF